MPSFNDRRRDPVKLPRLLWPQRVPKDRLPEICWVIDGLVPRDLSDASDLSVKEECPCILGGLLGDL
jgi:hypothetical protein